MTTTDTTTWEIRSEVTGETVRTVQDSTNPSPSPEQIAAARADLDALDDFFLREAADRAMADMQAACKASRGTWTPELARDARDASARGQAAWELIRERAHAVHVERLAAGDPVALREREIVRELARDLGYVKPSEGETEPERVGYTCKRCGGPAPMGVGHTSTEEGAWEASQGRTACPCGGSELSEDEGAPAPLEDALRDAVWDLPEAVEATRTPDGTWDLRCGTGRLEIGEERDEDGRVDGWTWTEWTEALDEGEWDAVTTDGQPSEGWPLVDRALQRWVVESLADAIALGA